MSCDTIFDATAQKQGWTPATQVSVLLNYIGNQNSVGAFADFLSEQAAEENAYGAPEAGSIAAQSPAKRLFYIVTGRVHGADEDIYHIVQAASRAEAIVDFKNYLLDDAYVDDSSPYESEGDYSHTVYVNTVLESDTEPREAV